MVYTNNHFCLCSHLVSAVHNLFLFYRRYSTTIRHSNNFWPNQWCISTMPIDNASINVCITLSIMLFNCILITGISSYIWNRSKFGCTVINRPLPVSSGQSSISTVDLSGPAIRNIGDSLALRNIQHCSAIVFCCIKTKVSEVLAIGAARHNTVATVVICECICVRIKQGGL